jgi:cytochrome P450
MMTLKETMRLYPSAPLIGRRSVADDELSGYLITGGSDVIIAPWITHRHPDFWPSPETFDPSRFTPALEKSRHRYAWHPFGGGPRACIGQHFSMLEGAIVLAGLVREFDFDSPAQVPAYKSDITLRPSEGAPVRITTRRVRTTR